MTKTINKTALAAAIALVSLGAMSATADAGGFRKGFGGFHGGGFGHGFHGGGFGHNKFGFGHRRCGFFKFGRFHPCR